MASLIDSSKLDPYTTSWRTRIAISSALSHTFNPRHLEEAYYPAYETTLNELLSFDFKGALIVRSRGTIWLSSAEVKQRNLALMYKMAIEGQHPEDLAVFEDADDTMDDFGFDEDHEDSSGNYIPTTAVKASSLPPRSRSERTRKPQQARQEQVLDQAVLGMNEYILHEEKVSRSQDPEEANVADLSFVSKGSNASIPESDPLAGIPDFTVCHSAAVEQPKPLEPFRQYAWEVRQHWKVIHECCPLFVENKTAPARNVPVKLEQREKWDEALKKLLQFAADQMICYLALYFARDLYAKRVVAIAASGIHWGWAEFHREDIPELFFSDIDIVIGNGVDPSVFCDQNMYSTASSKLSGSEIYQLGSPESDKALNEMRKVVISIVNDHKSYGPTMELPTRKVKSKSSKA